MATLEQFLRMGELDSLHLGMSEADVVALLGPAEDRSVSRQPRILKYGGLQLTFVKRPDGTGLYLSLIGLYFHPEVKPIPEVVRPTDFSGNPETTIADLREFLGRVGLTEAAFVEGEDDYLIMPSGARLSFDGKKLRSVILTGRKPTEVKKQIAVTVAEDTWKRLKVLAGDSDKSVAELCAEWVTERANEMKTSGGTADRSHDTSTAMGLNGDMASALTNVPEPIG